jgi:hypothetical protein
MEEGGGKGSNVNWDDVRREETLVFNFQVYCTFFLSIVKWKT